MHGWTVPFFHYIGPVISCKYPICNRINSLQAKNFYKSIFHAEKKPRICLSRRTAFFVITLLSNPFDYRETLKSVSYTHLSSSNALILLLADVCAELLILQSSILKYFHDLTKSCQKQQESLVWSLSKSNFCRF